MMTDAMRRAALFAFMAFVIASLLTYLFGDSGLAEHRRLLDYRNRLARNVGDLAAINGSLQAELETLRSDTGRTVVLARELGLFQAGDAILRIGGMSRQVESYPVGTLLRLIRADRLRGPWLKGAAIALAAVPAGIGATLRWARRKRGSSRR